PDTFRPECATSRLAPSVRALPAVRGDPASEPCRAAKADNSPNARLQRQSTDVRAFARVGRHGEAAGVDANGRQREPMSNTAAALAQLDRHHRAPVAQIEARADEYGWRPRET